MHARVGEDMTGATREVLIVIAVGMLAGLGFCVASAPSLDPGVVLDQIMDVARRAFEPEPWPLVLQAGGGALGAFLLLSTLR